MTELVVEAVKAVTELVATQAWEEISLVWGFKDHVEKLKDKLLVVQAFLEDVGKAKHSEKSQLVNCWLQKVKDVAYYADDIMDDYVYEMLRREVELGKNLSRRKKVCHFFTRSNNPIVYRFRMTHKVLDILSKFDELDKEAQNIGIKQEKLVREVLTLSTSPIGDIESPNLNQIRKHAAASASEFIGRDDDEKKLLEMIYSPENEKRQLSIIAIVGIGGKLSWQDNFSKTHIFDHEIEKGHFNKKAWICVSEEFNVDRLLKEIVESLSLKECDLSNAMAVTNRIQEELKGGKFFLVLDDIWNENEALWDSLKNQLKRIGVLAGCVILITTRSTDVAEKAGVVYSHKLKGLSKEESWALLMQKANVSSPSYDDIGIRLAEKCKGVPLALTTLGVLLRSKKSLSEWELLEKSDVWVASSENDANYILPSLLLSYHHLPSLALKQCFAYCAIFPKDCRIEKNELINLWIAQGFLNKVETNNLTLTMEKTGEDYCNILLNISFLQLEDNEEITAGTKRYFKMHDLVHDLAAHICQKDLLVLEEKVNPNTTFKYRHLIVNLKEEQRLIEVPKEEILERLRTVYIWGNVLPSWDLFMHARYVHTLIMVGMRIELVPDGIGQLKHLRYLDMSRNLMGTLPDSICRLYQLQRLRLMDCKYLSKLPTEFHRLINLRHVTIGGWNCQRLPSLGQLPNLRVLELRRFNDVKRVGEEWFVSDTSSRNNDDDVAQTQVGYFPALIELRIKSFPRLKTLIFPPEPAAVAFPSLQNFLIKNCPELEAVKTNLTVNFESLRHLRLHNVGGTQPLDIIKYHNSGLTSLYVGNMREMKSLPNELSNCTKLETLELLGCEQLVSFPAGLKSLVSLQKLSIVACSTLNCIPDDMFLGLSSLSELTISYCKTLATLPDNMFRGLSSLHELNIEKCDNLERIPTGLVECTSLEVLVIKPWDSSEFPNFVPNLNKLHGLVKLIVCAKNALTSMLKWIPHLCHLRELKTNISAVDYEFSDDAATSDMTYTQASLIRLELVDDTRTPNAKLFPLKLSQLHLPNLQFLRFIGFEELERLPDWIGTLSSLQELQLWRCKKLSFLPSKDHLTQLQCLSLWECPLLEERIHAKDGEPDSVSEWHNISHVPWIRFNKVEDLKK